jgi:hypothetical protein
MVKNLIQNIRTIRVKHVIVLINVISLVVSAGMR